MRLDTTLQGAFIDSVVYHSADVPYRKYAAVMHVEIDRQGNYLLGGMLASSVQFSPTVGVSNPGSCSVTDFWLGKYGKYNCDELADGIEDVFLPASRQEIRLFPNPVINGELIIDNGQLKAGDIVQIMDLTGKIILNSQFSILNSIDVSGLSSGMYFVKIGNKVGKFIKR
jgi:hypothetical protein